MPVVAQTGAGNVTTATGGAVQALTVAKPANVADGDLLLAVANSANGGGTWTIVPPGWTAASTTGSGRTAGIWTKPVPSAAAESDTDYTFGATGAGNARMGALVVRIIGADLAAPVDVVGSWTAALGLPGISPAREDCLLLAAWWSYITGTTPNAVSPPAGMASVGGWTVSPSSSTTHLLASEALSATGPTGSRTATASPAGSSALGVLLAIAPAQTGAAALTQTSALAAEATVVQSAAADLAQPSALAADGQAPELSQTAAAALAQTTALVHADPGQARVLHAGVWWPFTLHRLISGTWIPET
ncbi:hypothetical protein ACFVH6_21825 [Spirillospora sp. NPDC127200]